jgi:hypothetical protein
VSLWQRELQGLLELSDEGCPSTIPTGNSVDDYLVAFAWQQMWSHNSVPSKTALMLPEGRKDTICSIEESRRNAAR